VIVTASLHLGGRDAFPASISPGVRPPEPDVIDDNQSRLNGI
jgi:hypothetical protein